jgi:lysophospholipase
MKKVFLIVSLSLVSFWAQADELVNAYKKFSGESREHTFLDKKRETLYWVSLASAPSRGTVVISPGRSESRISYFELATLFQQNQYNVAIIEHRGQGKSARKLRPSDVGHIDQFEDYSEDFAQLVKEIQGQLPPPFYLLASSMGATIASSEPAVINSFDRVTMLAPMFKIRTLFFPKWLARAILSVFSVLRGPTGYAPFSGPFDPQASFEENSYAASRQRFKTNLELYHLYPELRVGGPSIKWVQEALDITEKIHSQMRLIKSPVLLLQAEDEYFVDNQVQDEYCGLMVHCQVFKVPGSRHALHLDSDQNLQLIFKMTQDFFN